MHPHSRPAPVRAMPSRAAATVREIRPLLGLAYVEDEVGREWTITRSTQGIDLDQAAAGQRVQLTFEVYGHAAFVRECRPAG